MVGQTSMAKCNVKPAVKGLTTFGQETQGAYSYNLGDRMELTKKETFACRWSESFYGLLNCT